MSKVDLWAIADPERDINKFNSREKQEAAKLKRTWETQGLPYKYSREGAHIRREKASGKVFIFNKSKQICMLNEGRLEIYYRCPKCFNEGFKNTLSHNPRCDEIPW